MEPHFIELSDDFSVIMPSPPPSLPSFREIFLPQKRKSKEESSGFVISRFLNLPPSEYLCVFCQNVVKKPLECKKCGKLYCDSCSFNLHKIDESSGSRVFACMICGCSQEPRQPSQVLTRMISELKIKCINFEAGCSDYITIDEISRHDQICPFREVLCENHKYCRKTGLIRDFKETEGALRSIYSHISNRAHGRGKSYTCSEKCKRFVTFERMVNDKQFHKALNEYHELLANIKLSER